MRTHRHPPLTGHQVGMLASLLCMQFFDGFDLLATSLAASSIARTWGLSAPVLGTVLAATQAGSLVGAIAIGRVAGLIGRRRAVIASALLIGFSGLATAFASRYDALLACRVAAGLGLGGLAPLVVGYASGFVPDRITGRVTAFLLSGVQFGQIAGGGIAALILPRYGWPALFLLGGGGPLLLVPLLLLLPRSTGERGDAAQDAQRIASRCAVPASKRQASVSRGDRGGFRAALQRRGGVPVFALLLATGLLGGLATYFMNSWVAVLVERRGATVTVAVLCLSFFHAGAAIGTLAIGWLMDKASPYLTLALVLAGAAPLLVALGLVPPVPWLLHGLCLLIGILMSGGLISILTLAALIFSDDVKVDVLAWITAVAKLAGIAAPLASGFMVGAGAPPSAIFMTAAACVLGASLAIGCTASVGPRLSHGRAD